MRNVVLSEPSTPPKSKAERYDPLILTTSPTPKPGPGQVLVRLRAAALNHKDIYYREGMMPLIKYGATLGCDGAGDVAAVGDGVEPSLVGRAVYLNSQVGWESDPVKPEDRKVNGTLGSYPLPGTLAEYIVVPRSIVHDKPPHLSYEEAAAVPLAGLTAWRALVTLGEAKKGSKILVPGIGGGVAIFALQFGLALGCEVWVTSGSDEKLARAIKLGAKGGVNYKRKDWATELEKLSGGEFDAIIDGSSGPNTRIFMRLVKEGGIISIYGAVAGSNSTITMPYIWFKACQLRGSRMGNNAEFRAMTKLINETGMRPEVSGVWDGLEAFEGAFEEMREGKQFGKLVVRIDKQGAKL
ncbi:hypothetical protein DFJ74DRAFT_613809 [Hyaloraphidium curvatum]|nr:hypothetical protein DFJ74DRAFT_613809 [Hyaloraphidium curvatum]